MSSQINNAKCGVRHLVQPNYTSLSTDKSIAFTGQILCFRRITFNSKLNIQNYYKRTGPMSLVTIPNDAEYYMLYTHTTSIIFELL